MEIVASPSPNFDERKFPVDMLVLHYTGMETGQAALDRMRDPAAKVSAHYMIWEDGQIDQLVAEDKRAWHAGVSSWQGDEDLNSRSIGIEIVNGGHDVPLPDGSLPPYPAAQIGSVIGLCRAILSRHGIPQSRIVAHSDIAPARKIDPGEHFPWAHLAEAGIGLFPGTGPAVEADLLLPGDTGPPVRTLQESLAGIGYGLVATGAFDEATAQVVSAFQRRFLTSHLGRHGDPETQAHVGQVLAAVRAV
ncbi:MAG: N-acetylmuramoyl-L-alanine amidase [Hyphomonas sp.]